MLLLVVLLIWAGMHVYVFWRAGSVPIIARRVSPYLLAGAACFLFLSYILARILNHFRAGYVAQVLEVIGATWIGVLFLLLVTLFAIDVLTLFGRLSPRLAPALRGWALLAGGALSIIAIAQGHRAPVVQDYEVSVAGLPRDSDGTVIVFASDFHLEKTLGKDWLPARISLIEAQRPDLIVLGGDIVEGDDDSEEAFLPPLRRLSASYGVWAVTGNHEYYGRSQNRTSELDETGIGVLHDRWVEVKGGLILAGVDDLGSRRHHGQNDNFIAQALSGRPAGAATILVSHSPDEAEIAAKSGVGLLLAGHTHAGQIWPFGYIVRLFYPLLAGKYEVNGMPVIVCRGTGTWGPRMRLWQRSEIVRVTLRSLP